MYSAWLSQFIITGYNLLNIYDQAFLCDNTILVLNAEFTIQT